MGKRVLVVEDDAQVRGYVAAALESSGAALEVVTAENGREAALRLAERDVDLVLTDLNMPGMTGLELIRQLRAEQPEVRLVLMSGTSADWLPELALEGLDELPLLVKPVSVDQLIDLVAGILGI